MVVTKVILVRHGETFWNLEGRQQGHLDSPLSPSGMVQAESLAMCLQTKSFSRLYASDLQRAMRTAEIIGHRCSLTPIPDARLRERHLGIFQGLTWREACTKYPEVAEQYRQGDPDYVLPEGESARQRNDRGMACLAELAERHPGETIVAVTHSGILDGIFRTVLGIPLGAPRRFRLLNASLNVFHYAANAWYLECWNDLGHLPVESMDEQ